MFRSFWFYFNAVPVVFSILFFSINLLLVWDRLNFSNDYQGPPFADAVEHCKDVSNDTWADDERTYQDVCVDIFMGDDESFMTTTSELFWVLGLLLSIVGIAFVVPLSIYLLLSWRMHRYGHY
tara:strand:- start:150 stop:518 length:369 start_codon:yes stop_codon:yes gene_type:complete